MVGSGEEASEARHQVFKLLIKNPSRTTGSDFSVEVPTSATVSSVKEKLAAVYEGNPQPSKQTLIYGGRVLRDDHEVLQKILRQDVGANSKHTMHLVVKGTDAGSSFSQHPVSSRPSPQSTMPTATPRTSTDATNASSAASSSQPQPPIFQAGYSSSGWQTSQPDPTILAAYNAALESLRNRPPFPTMPGAARNAPPGAQAPLGGAYGPHSGYMPPFSIPPTLLVPPAMPHSQAGASRPSSGQEAPSSSGEGLSGTSASASQSPSSSQQESRLPQLYAPALAYVPVNLVQQNPQQQPSLGVQHGTTHPQAAGNPGAGVPPGAAPQQLFPYPQFAPVLPMMMPFGFNPYGHPVAPGQQPPNHAAQFLHPAQPQAPMQAFQGMPQPPQPAGQPHARPPPQVRVRLIRINLKLLLQLGILALIVYQNTSHARFIKLVGSAVALYFLWPIVNRNNAVQRRIRRLLQPQAQPAQPRQPPAGVQAPRADAAHPVGGNAGQPVRQAGGLLREIQALLVGFFTSLLPGFNMNAEDAAAFAQAQRIMAQEAAAEQQQRMGRQHID